MIEFRLLFICVYIVEFDRLRKTNKSDQHELQSTMRTGGLAKVVRTLTENRTGHAER